MNNTPINMHQKNTLIFSPSKIIKNSFWSISGWGGNLLINFLSAPIFIFFVGQEDYGLMILLYSIIGPMGLLDLGISEATIKYISESLGKNEHGSVEKFAQNTFLFNLIVGIIGCILINLLSNLLIYNFFNIPVQRISTALNCLYWLSLMWLVSQIQKTFTGAITAIQRYDLISIGNFLGLFVKTALSIIVLVFGGDILDLFKIQSFTSIVLCFIWYVIAKRNYKNIIFLPSFHSSYFKKSFQYGSWQLLNNLGGILTQTSQRWLLGSMLNIKMVGFFHLGLQICVIPYLIAYQIGQVFFPAISELEGANQKQKAAIITIQASWLLSSLSIATFIPLIIFTYEILYIWIGHSIANEITELTRIISIGAAIGSTFSIINYYLLGIGKANWLAFLSLSQGLIILVTTFTLIPLSGIIGAAWGFTLGTAAHVICLILVWTRFFYRYTKLMDYLCSIFSPYILGVIFCIFLLHFKKSIFPTYNWIFLVPVSCLIFIAFLTCIIFIGIILPGGDERKKLLLKYFKKIIYSNKI